MIPISGNDLNSTNVIKNCPAYGFIYLTGGKSMELGNQIILLREFPYEIKK